MAKLSADKTYVTVEKGDSLWNIARDYLGSGTKWKQLASINNVPQSGLILVGDKIYLKKQTSPTPTTKKKTSTNKPVIKKFGLQASVENSIFATWKWDKSYVDNYKITWQYYTEDKYWFVGEDSTTTYKYSIYSIPSEATRVRFRVKPIAKKKKVKKTVKGKNGKTTTKEYEEYRWTAEWSGWKTFDIKESPPSTPTSGPSVTIKGTKLTAELENLDTSITSCEFQVVKNDKKTVKTGTAKVTKRAVSYSCKIDLGGEYKVRYRSIKNKLKSGWSDYSSNVGTAPATPKEIKSIKTLSETSVELEWTKVSNATSFTVEYTTKKMYFNSSTEVSSITVTQNGKAQVTGLSSGERYFFRVKAVNDKGESGWTPIKDIVVGKKPAAPTTWSSTTTATTGEDVTLYWVHNSEDGSSQTYAELELTINGTKSIQTIKNTNTGDNIDKTSKYTLNTSTYTTGTQIKWRVRTKGILNTYGDWSIQRAIDVYASSTLELIVYKSASSSDTSLESINSFPFYISALAGPTTQTPISYHLSIISNDLYDTVDAVGNTKTVREGDEVYSKYFDTSDDLLVEMSAGNIDLENGMSYTVTCTVSMNSGLTAESSVEFLVEWDEEAYIPNAEIGIDEDIYSAVIRPYCSESVITFYKVELTGGKYVQTETVIDDDLYGDIFTDDSGISVSTTNGRLVYSGINADGEDILYCIDDETEDTIEGVTLSVYRREFDGGFTEIASDLDNVRNTFVVDPHPALDYARYRIVATTESTGAVAYYDMPSVVVGCKEVIIQWDEEAYTFDIDIDDYNDPMDQPTWAGSMLRLPYNIDVSDKYGPDVELVEYIGRKHPVSYYGTQRGESSTWNVEIEKTDEETIYALRRLATWPGDVYVREPSGSGYWAHVSVSFSQKHRELTIPVTLEITRVEGGM